MEISKIINEVKTNQREIQRFKYPFDEKSDKKMWMTIISLLIEKKIIINNDNKKAWNQIIKYLHCENSEIETLKAIGISGKTGSGKTVTMLAMQKYIEFKNIKYRRGEKDCNFLFKIFHSNIIVRDFQVNGHEGLTKYCTYLNICIDDLGAEIQDATHFGTKLNVIQYIIEERYSKNLITHFTTNLNIELISEKYGDRVYSRIVQKTNILIMNDCDYRIL